MIFIAIRAARDVFAIIGVECGAGECGASFHAVPIGRDNHTYKVTKQTGG